MNGRVLVAYGSRFGSTAEIAEAIGMELGLHGLDVTVMPAEKVRSVEAFKFVIVGSAMYAHHWRRAAVRLLRSQRSALRSRRVWLFQSGLSVVGPGAAQDPTPDAVVALAKEIGTVRPVTFAGALLPSTARGFIARRMARGPSGGEHRDWDRIRAWARGVAAEIASSTGEDPAPVAVMDGRT